MGHGVRKSRGAPGDSRCQRRAEFLTWKGLGDLNVFSLLSTHLPGQGNEDPMSRGCAVQEECVTIKTNTVWRLKHIEEIRGERGEEGSEKGSGSWLLFLATDRLCDLERIPSPLCACFSLLICQVG